jgi:hypothetical protein
MSSLTSPVLGEQVPVLRLQHDTAVGASICDWDVYKSAEQLLSELYHVNQRGPLTTVWVQAEHCFGDLKRVWTTLCTYRQPTGPLYQVHLDFG